jgi:DNA recombination protein RmuC
MVELVTGFAVGLIIAWLCHRKRPDPLLARIHEDIVALRSPTVRGQWGEMQLRRLVEAAGLKEHVDFESQVSTEDGRPDLVVTLPNGGAIPIDAKATAELRDRVRELGRKKYWEQFERAPEFVILFVPNEGAFAEAFEHDPGLLDHALGQNVIPASPLTLLALLKTISFGWQQARMADNARRVSEQGGELVARLNVFLEHLAKAGGSLEAAVRAYHDATNSLHARVLPAAQKLHDLGVSRTLRDV